MRRGLLAIAVLGALLAASAAVSAPSVLPRATQDHAAPRKGWRFAGWRGACRGTRACRVALPANRTVRAVFRKAPRG